MQNRPRATDKVASVLGAILILVGMTPHAYAATVHITFFKSRHAMEGSGNLFYGGEKYGLRIEGTAANSLKSSRSDLAGSVENMHAATDILGTYEPTEAGGSTIVDNGKPVRIKNANGVILDLRGVNLGVLPLDLAGLTITSRGWGPDAKQRISK